MNLQEVLRAINQLQEDGIIEQSAIGGAIAATFYLEPITTLDVDVFVAFKPTPGSAFISLQPIFEYLVARGCSVRDEYIQIGGWPVQFLPPTGPLAEEALVEAIAMTIEGEQARVFTAEHLAAIALQVGRPKDQIRLLQFVQEGALNEAAFQAILIRHALTEPWRKFQQRFLDP